MTDAASLVLLPAGRRPDMFDALEPAANARPETAHPAPILPSPARSGLLPAMARFPLERSAEIRADPAFAGVAGEAERFGLCAGWEAAVVVPARNEARRIAACLDALGHSLGPRGGIVVVVNNSTDDSAAIARQWFLGRDRPGIVVTSFFPAERAGVGLARRLGVAAARAALRPGGAVLTTDADCEVAPDWLARNLLALDGADLVCGTIRPLAAEAAQLPALLGTRWAPEGEYTALSVAIAAALDPRPHDPAPAHMVAPGASLAFRLALYDDIGGMPPIPLCEDRAFAALAEARDWRVSHPAEVIIHASCRMTGRTPGGMAGTLRAWMREPDPLCDEWLEPAAATLRRNRLRGRLRRAWAAGAADSVLARLAPVAARRVQAGRFRHFGSYFGAVEAASPALARVRMRLARLEAELPLLRLAADRLGCGAQAEQEGEVDA